MKKKKSYFSIVCLSYNYVCYTTMFVIQLHLLHNYVYHIIQSHFVMELVFSYPLPRNDSFTCSANFYRGQIIWDAAPVGRIEEFVLCSRKVNLLYKPLQHTSDSLFFDSLILYIHLFIYVFGHWSMKQSLCSTS